MVKTTTEIENLYGIEEEVNKQIEAIRDQISKIVIIC